MSLTNAIKNIRRNLLGVNALANLADVNTAIDQALAYRILGFELNHPLGLAPSFTIVNGGPCPPPGCDCSGGTVLCFTFTNIAVGVYSLKMSEPAVNGFNVLVSPLADAKQNIGVEVISNTEVLISTYDTATGAYVNNAFKNTYLQLLLRK